MTFLKFGILLGAMISTAASAAEVAPPCHASPSAAATSQARVSVQGFGRGFTQPALQALISRAVSLAEADARSAGHQWSFAVQTGGDNRPTTLIVGAMQDSEHRPVSGFYRTASLGTAPPLLFIEEMRMFARMLISHEHRQVS